MVAVVVVLPAPARLRARGKEGGEVLTRWAVAPPHTHCACGNGAAGLHVTSPDGIASPPIRTPSTPQNAPLHCTAASIKASGGDDTRGGGGTGGNGSGAEAKYRGFGVVSPPIAMEFEALGMRLRQLRGGPKVVLQVRGEEEEGACACRRQGRGGAAGGWDHPARALSVLWRHGDCHWPAQRRRRAKGRAAGGGGGGGGGAERSRAHARPGFGVCGFGPSCTHAPP